MQREYYAATRIFETTHQVSLRQTTWILQQTIQPLAAAALHPAWRAKLVSRQKIDRGADAKRQSARLTTRLKLCSHLFLLRTTRRKETKPERAMFFNELRQVSTAWGSLINPIGGL